MAESHSQSLMFPEGDKIDNLMLTLPYSVSEVKKLFSSSLHHVGLNMVWKSYRAHRSTKKASVFLFGKSGAGKSSILNYLFGTELIPTSMMQSTTRDVAEYGCEMESLHWKVAGLRIGFVDTPGFLDTSGVNKDAINLTKISEFVKSEYITGPIRIFPNIVLVVADASDKRFFALESDFSKMLQILSKLDVVDRKRPNVVIAITHALSLKKKMFAEKSQVIANGCRILSKLHLSVEAPVVFIENDDDEDELENEGDWKILPDGTRQPLNLFQTMIDLMKVTGDEIGIEAIRMFFGNSKEYTITQPIMSGGDTEVHQKDISYWTSLIQKQYVLEPQNEVFAALIKGYQEIADLKIDEWQVTTLAYNLKKSKIVKRSSIQGKNLVLITQLIRPYIMNKVEVRLLCEIFNLSALDKLNYQDLGVGYSLSTEERKRRVFDVSLKELKLDSGVFVPENATTKQCDAISIDIQYKDEKGIKISLSRFFSRNENINLSIKFQCRYHLVKVAMNDISSLNLNSEFQYYLTQKLSNGDSPKQSPIEIDKVFGSYAISELHFGGIIEGSFNLRCSGETYYLIKLVREIKILLEAYFEYLLNGTMLTEANPPLELDMDLFKEIKFASLKWRGGDSAFHSKTFAELQVKQWRNWIASLCNNPVLIHDVSEKNPLSNLLRLNKNKDISQLSRYVTESIPCQDMNDLYFYTSTELLTEILFKRDHKEEANIYTRTLASDRSKSKLSLCSIL